VGNKTVAKEGHMNEPYLRVANKILADAGLVVKIRRLYESGPVVRQVAMSGDEFLVQTLKEPEDGNLPRLPVEPWTIPIKA
jgi:hypothetical protein